MFTIEEISLMKMYSGLKPNRKALICNLKNIMPHFLDEEQEIKDLTCGVIRKLTAMNDNNFSNINFSLALDEEGPEEAY